MYPLLPIPLLSVSLYVLLLYFLSVSYLSPLAFFLYPLLFLSVSVSLFVSLLLSFLAVFYFLSLLVFYYISLTLLFFFWCLLLLLFSCPSFLYFYLLISCLPFLPFLYFPFSFVFLTSFFFLHMLCGVFYSFIWLSVLILLNNVYKLFTIFSSPSLIHSAFYSNPSVIFLFFIFLFAFLIMISVILSLLSPCLLEICWSYFSTLDSICVTSAISDCLVFSMFW